MNEPQERICEDHANKILAWLQAEEQKSGALQE